VTGSPFELRGHGQEEEIGEANAVDGGGECRRDAVPELARVGEVLHDRHETEDGADDPKRRAIDSHAFENLCRAGIGMFARVELHLHDVADHLRLTAVDHELQRLAYKSVGLLGEHRLETQQPLLAGDVAPFHHLLDELAALQRRRTHDPGEDPHGAFHDGKRSLYEDGGDGADDDDGERGGGHERHQACAFEHGAGEDGAQAERESDDAEDIHECVCPYAVAAARDSRILSILSLRVTAVNGLMT
jgi:hypothetical protein